MSRDAGRELVLLPAVALSAVRLLAWLGCAFLVVVAPTNVVMQVVFGAVPNWHRAAGQLVVLAVGVFAGWTMLRYGSRGDGYPREADRCRVNGWVRPQRRLRRMGWFAAAVPVFGFTLPHWLWAVGLSIGTTEESALTAVKPWLWMLGAVPLFGALLTLGLVQRWGQILPEWVPLLGDMPVPRGLALAPALAVAVMLAQYGAMMTQCSGSTLLGLTDSCYGASQGYLTDNWAFTATYPVFLIWGVALGVTALGYVQLTGRRSSPPSPQGKRRICRRPLSGRTRTTRPCAPPSATPPSSAARTPSFSRTIKNS